MNLITVADPVALIEGATSTKHLSRAYLFPVFFGVWVILGIAALVLFILNNDARFKKRWYPRFVIAVGVLFVAFAATLGFPLTHSPRRDADEISPVARLAPHGRGSTQPA